MRRDTFRNAIRLRPNKRSVRDGGAQCRQTNRRVQRPGAALTTGATWITREKKRIREKMRRCDPAGVMPIPLSAGYLWQQAHWLPSRLTLRNHFSTPVAVVLNWR